MTTGRNGSETSPQLATPQEVAAFLRVPLSFIYKRTGPAASDPIPHRRVGRLLRFDLAEVQEWLDQSKARDGAA